MTTDCVAYLMTYELHVLEVYVYGASDAVLYCTDSTSQRLHAVCAATARLLFIDSLRNSYGVSKNNNNTSNAL